MEHRIQKFNTVLVCDIEATCWKGAPPPGEISELIEIGIVEVDLKKNKLLNSMSIPIKPTMSRVSEFCEQLTGWTQEQLDLIGITFAEGCSILENEFDSKNRLWISMGNYDRKMFEKQCPMMGIPYPFGPNHLNVAPFIAMLTGRSKSLGMLRTMKLLDLEPIGRHHNGEADAKNIARAFLKVINLCRVDLSCKQVKEPPAPGEEINDQQVTGPL